MRGVAPATIAAAAAAAIPANDNAGTPAGVVVVVAAEALFAVMEARGVRGAVGMIVTLLVEDDVVNFKGANGGGVGDIRPVIGDAGQCTLVPLA